MPKKNPLADPLRPHGGWLRSIRQTSGLSLQAVADRLDVSPQAVHQFEKSEAAGTISLRQLAIVAAAIGGHVTYSVTLPDKRTRAASRAKSVAANPPPPPPAPAVLATTPPPIEHSMFLDNQASGRFD